MQGILLIIILLLGFWISDLEARTKFYGERFCRDDAFRCVKIDRGDTWKSLWPDSRERDIVARLNRMNIPLRAGMRIAVPRFLRSVTLFDIAPFPLSKGATGKKLVIVDLSDQAWGAYDETGMLLRWGPISGGKGWCPDVNRRCRTITGTFAFYTTRGPSCYSFKYPIPKGGAPMPYCMFFFRGFALHGSPVVPGYHASHGCIRAFTEDAKWLNENFINLPYRNNVRRGTTVIVRP